MAKTEVDVIRGQLERLLNRYGEKLKTWLLALKGGTGDEFVRVVKDIENELSFVQAGHFLCGFKYKKSWV